MLKEEEKILESVAEKTGKSMHVFFSQISVLNGLSFRLL